MGLVGGIILLIFAVFAVAICLISIFPIYSLLYKCVECTPEELVNKVTSFPIHVKIRGKVANGNTSLTSPIDNHPNCLMFKSQINYYYDKQERIKVNNFFTREDERGSTTYRSTSYEMKISKETINVLCVSDAVSVFDIVAEADGERVRVDTRGAITNHLNDIDKTGSFSHVEERGTLDSSYYTLRHPTNPNFEFEIKEQLPKPHSESCFELKEKWVEVTDDYFLTVYGIADKVDGAVVVGTIPTCIGPNMVVTNWSVRKVERVVLGLFVGSLLSSITLVTLGLVLVTKS